MRPRRRRHRRLAPAWWALAVALLAFAGLIWWHHHASEPARLVPPSDRPRLVAAARAALLADPNVADLVYSASREQWDVTPATASTDAAAFARYVCFVLEARHVTRAATSVRVIDPAALEAHDFDYAAASRGQLTCSTERR